jgi:hypothetical protein
MVAKHSLQKLVPPKGPKTSMEEVNVRRVTGNSSTGEGWQMVSAGHRQTWTLNHSLQDQCPVAAVLRKLHSAKVWVPITFQGPYEALEAYKRKTKQSQTKRKRTLALEKLTVHW